MHLHTPHTNKELDIHTRSSYRILDIIFVVSFYNICSLIQLLDVSLAYQHQ